MTTILICHICHDPILRGQTMIDDHHAGCQPDVQHLWRREDSPSAFCGDESARPWMPVTREESLAVPVCALCHQRVMHESYNLWANEALAQEPTDAEVHAGRTVAAQSMPAAWWGGTEWRRYVEEILSAARAARRDGEKR